MRGRGEDEDEEVPQSSPPPPSRSELIRRYDECLRLNDGRLILKGVCARAGVVTHNARVYPYRALERAVAAFQRGPVRCGLAIGELDHPSYATPIYRCVSLANASHAVLRLEWRRIKGSDRRSKKKQGGGEAVALVEALPTPSGLLLWALAARGVPLASSQRCWAEVEWRRRSGGGRQVGYVCPHTLELLAIDVVPDPANAGAWLVPVVRRVVGGGGGWRWWMGGFAPPAAGRVDPSAVTLAHLGAGAVSPALAAESGLDLPTAATVVEALRCAAVAAAAGAAASPSSARTCVGPVQLSSHYSDPELDEAPELAQLVAAAWDEPAGEGGGGGGGQARPLAEHWRRFAERALRCESRERARVEEEEEEGEESGGGGRAGGGRGCLCLPWQQRRRQRGRRRAASSLGGRLASVAPLRSPLVAVDDGADGRPANAKTAAAAAADPAAANVALEEAEVDAVLWSRADKARDVRRRVLRRWLS